MCLMRVVGVSLSRLGRTAIVSYCSTHKISQRVHGLPPVAMGSHKKT